MAGKTSISLKHIQIQKASSTVFVAVAVAAVIVSMSIVILNILWGNSQYNSRVQGEQEKTRDTLIANLEAVPTLEASFNNLQIGDDLITNQGAQKENSEVVLDALPSKFDFPAIASSIDNLASRNSVELTGFTGVDLGSAALQSSPSPSPEAIPISMEVEGSYTAIGKFLRDIESSIRPMVVTSLSLSGTDDKLSAKVNMETYYQPAFDLSITRKVIQ